MEEKCHIVSIEEHNRNKKELMVRLNKIEGQVRGIKKMIEDDIYCDDVLNQVSSVKSALNGVSKAILERHINTCVIKKIKNGEVEIVDELLNTINKILKI